MIIDLETVIKQRDVDAKELAKVLWPDLKFPTKALNRIFKGKSELNCSELIRASEFLGMSPAELLGDRVFYVAHEPIEEGYIKIMFDPTSYVLHRPEDNFSEVVVDRDVVIFQGELTPDTASLNEYLGKVKETILSWISLQ